MTTPHRQPHQQHSEVVPRDRVMLTHPQPLVPTCFCSRCSSAVPVAPGSVGAASSSCASANSARVRRRSLRSRFSTSKSRWPIWEREKQAEHTSCTKSSRLQKKMHFFPLLGCWFPARHLPALFSRCSHSVPSHLSPGHLQHCHWGLSHDPDCGFAGRSSVVPPTLHRFEVPEASNLEGKDPKVY